jgi:hypothetical protein
MIAGLPDIVMTATLKRDFDPLVAAFWTTGGGDIVKGRLSRRGGKFRHFDDSDLENITALRNDPSPAVPSRLR